MLRILLNVATGLVMTLRAMLKQGEKISAPGVFDPFSARIADSLGFSAIYMTGYGVNASLLGLPDAAFASYGEMVERVRQIAEVTDAALIADGDTGELLNFHRLNTENLDAAISKKSLDGGDLAPKYVSIKFAEGVALGVIQSELDTKGMVVQADSDIFEGYDSYVFEIDAINGKSYDVYVALDGHVLGYDEYEAEEAADIEAEAAELALKRAYSDDQREEMAKEGMALPDGSYPIRDEADLRNAIQASGRAKDKEKAKRHIMKRAMDLGKEDLIPMNWVPKKDQDAAKREEGKKSDHDEQSQLMKDLLEFEMLTAEEDLKKFL